jgi:hypothetical protein
MPLMRDVTNTAVFGRPRGLTEIPLGYALGDRTYLLHSIFWRNVTHRTHLRYRQSVSRDNDRLAGLDTIDKLRRRAFASAMPMVSFI